MTNILKRDVKNKWKISTVNNNMNFIKEINKKENEHTQAMQIYLMMYMQNHIKGVVSEECNVYSYTYYLKLKYNDVVFNLKIYPYDDESILPYTLYISMKDNCFEDNELYNCFEGNDVYAAKFTNEKDIEKFLKQGIKQVKLFIDLEHSLYEEFIKEMKKLKKAKDNIDGIIVRKEYITIKTLFKIPEKNVKTVLKKLKIKEKSMYQHCDNYEYDFWNTNITL